ncbi:hypothetical protein [Bogoriella caseilytica]|uniref:Secreted protein n=1 Tax=Bogoriella caseilytica TaxID=56055 RepID=A0A3N2B8V6_9MICO|nr:hypothetical protein [Bogoriella caseilytica]ROR71716.1 hypothetical protein EDD31_0053 [Bogoriella caseilytica]
MRTSRTRSRLFAITAATLLVMAPAASASAAGAERAPVLSPSLVEVQEPVVTPDSYICSVMAWLCRIR